LLIEKGRAKNYLFLIVYQAAPKVQNTFLNMDITEGRSFQSLANFQNYTVTCVLFLKEPSQPTDVAKINLSLKIPPARIAISSTKLPNVGRRAKMFAIP
jgi:hypothetical protein